MKKYKYDVDIEVKIAFTRRIEVLVSNDESVNKVAKRQFLEYLESTGLIQRHEGGNPEDDTDYFIPSIDEKYEDIISPTVEVVGFSIVRELVVKEV